jgi:hypothetical protein
MKYYLLTIFILIMLPWSIIASNTASVQVNVVVKYPDIILESYSGDINISMFPGTRSEVLEFQWHFIGAKGISYNVTGTWIQELGVQFFVDADILNNPNGQFNRGNGKSQLITYNFRVNCMPGTSKGTYTGIYLICVSYN